MQLGILFDAQKLGAGFYGYSAFRILFSILPPKELAGSSLYHGEIGEGKIRPYCIAIESEDRAQLLRLKNAVAQSAARGLMPLANRFAEEMILRDEVLVLAARIDSGGQMQECQSRWLQDAWERAIRPGSLATAEPVRAPAGSSFQRTATGAGSERSTSSSSAARGSSGQSDPAARSNRDLRTFSPQLSGPPPWALRWTPLGRGAFAWLMAGSISGACLPWLGWPLALSLLVISATVVWGASAGLRLSAESYLSSQAFHQEVLRALHASRFENLKTQLHTPLAQASPVLRRVSLLAQVWSQSGDLAGACAAIAQQERADRAEFQADWLQFRTLLWGSVAMPACLLAGIHLFAGPQASAAEAPWLLVAALASWMLLSWAASWLRSFHERLQSQVDRMVAALWMPAILRAVPPPKSKLAADPALSEIRSSFEQLHQKLDQLQQEELNVAISKLQDAVTQLGPILAGFREPFVLQAVPLAGRQKAMSA
ncbi:MAG: hypothetical protein NZV14_06420 [Bryobacteraceae bacterium]|nr:hypothetical protein [Bryobacteraceae bacterium]MDW8377777.1 hypothetical protein [Bryobacterales bacterium]